MTHIIHPIPTGVAITTPTGDLPIEQVAAQVAPDGNYAIVDSSVIPTDRFFRAAWIFRNNTLEIDLAKAKEIGQQRRRAARDTEFKPLDDVIAKQIPGIDLDAAEAGRALIRKKYEAMQAAINDAKTPDEIKAALGV